MSENKLRAHDYFTGVYQNCKTEPEQLSFPFITKDSGERTKFEGGMQRDTTIGKVRPDLCFDGPMFMRWAELMTRGAFKYEARNWMKASGRAEMERFCESAVRHFVQWYFRLNPEEDHAAAIFFNVNGVEYLRSKGE